jgi:hypothetical protein
VHLIYLHDLYCFVRLYSVGSFTKRLYPIVDSYMTAFKKSANGTKAKTFEIKFKRLPLDISAFADILYRMSISTRFTFMALSPVNDAIFFAISTTTFWTGDHVNTS